MRLFIRVSCLLCLSSFLFGEDELPQIKKMKEVYQSELDRVTKPVKSKYYRALVKLQKDYTTANKLDEALAVKKEIDRLLATNQARPKITTRPALTMQEPDRKPEKSDDDESNELREWRGDGKLTTDGGTSVIEVSASNGIEELDYTFDVEDFPRGVLLKFDYKTKDYEGEGLMIRGFNTPTGSYMFPVSVSANDRWQPVTYSFPRAKYTSPTTNQEAKEIRMVIQILSGDGDIVFKDIKLKEL